MQDLISIIIPLYNKAKSIGRTIDSVLNQNFKNFELIIVDDGSTDQSKNIVQEFSDSRIRYFYKNNGGVSSARNFGAKVANSKWLYFLDADDLITESGLEELSKNREKFRSVEIIVGGYIIRKGKQENYIYPEKEGLIRYPLKSWWKNKIFPRTGNFLITKNAFFSLGGFDERISYNEDFAFVLKMLSTYEIACRKSLIMVYTDDDKKLSISKTPLSKEIGAYLEPLSIENIYVSYFVYKQYQWTIQRRKDMEDESEAIKIENEFHSKFSLADRLRNWVMDMQRRIINKLRRMVL